MATHRTLQVSQSMTGWYIFSLAGSEKYIYDKLYWTGENWTLNYDLIKFFHLKKEAEKEKRKLEKEN